MASDGAEIDNFGFSVAISGDTVVVGAEHDDDNGIDSGSAYVFERNQEGIDNWGQVTKLLASDGAATDHFGFSVAISGVTVVVGALRDDDNSIDSGSAYVFERNQGGTDNWGQVTKLLASDGAEGDFFGVSVASSGNTVVVGASQFIFFPSTPTGNGAAYVFNLSSELTNDEPPPTDTVDLVLDGSGDTVGENITHPNGNVYNQVLLTGQSVTLRSDGTEITRLSFLDVNEDIVQVEFSGNAVVTIDLDPVTFESAAPPVKYNQPSVSYVKGKANITVEQADENTFLSIFTVGSINAVNQDLFPEGEVYDAMADIVLLEITNSTGIGGILCANTRFSGSSGDIGLKAPGVPVSVRVLVGDIDASEGATPHLSIGEGSFTVAAPNPGLRITGGDLMQSNGTSVVVAPSGSLIPGFDTLISQNNVKSDGTDQPTQIINATFSNADGEEILVSVEEVTIE